MVGQKMIENEEISASIVMTVKIHVEESNKSSQDFQSGVIDISHRALVRKTILTKLKECRNGEQFFTKEIVENRHKHII